MKLEMVIAPPPEHIYDACDRVFRIKGRRYVMFTVGLKLFNPDNAYVSPALWAHEEVHSVRQVAGGDIDGWWQQYLDNREFRFAEELAAHQEEWRVVRDTVSSRQQRRKQLGVITDRLSGALYGHLVTRQEAKRLVAGAAE